MTFSNILFYTWLGVEIMSYSTTNVFKATYLCKNVQVMYIFALFVPGLHTNEWKHHALLKLTSRQGGSAAEDWAPGPEGRSSDHWGSNQKEKIRTRPQIITLLKYMKHSSSLSVQTLQFKRYKLPWICCIIMFNLFNNSLWQRVQLLLDQAFDLHLFSVISETQEPKFSSDRQE